LPNRKVAIIHERMTVGNGPKIFERHGTITTTMMTLVLLLVRRFVYSTRSSKADSWSISPFAWNRLWSGGSESRCHLLTIQRSNSRPCSSFAGRR